MTLTILPAPVGPAPAWLKAMAGPLSLLPLAAIFLAWWLIRQTPFYDQLMAVGSDDRAAYTAGVPVTLVRFLAYVLTGVLAGAAGLMLTALIGSADPNIGPSYTLIAIAAAAWAASAWPAGAAGLPARPSARSTFSCCRALLTAFNVSTFCCRSPMALILVSAVC